MVHVTAAVEIVKVLALAGLLCEIAARIGDAALRLFGRRGPDLERFGLGLLLGWPLVGTAFFGMALAGLLRPVPLVVALAGAAAAAWWRDGGRPLASGALREWSARGYGWTLPALALTVYLAAWLVPEDECDSLVYHLAAPQQWLAAGRAFYGHVGVNFHLSLPVEMTYVLAFIGGDDRITKFIAASFLVGAAAVWEAEYKVQGTKYKAGPREGRAEDTGTWLGTALALSLAGTFFLLTRSKNDLPAAALFLAAAGLPGRGARSAGLAALLFGCAAAAKYTCLPAIAVWLALRPASWRSGGRTLAFLAVPLLPWLAKSWLVLGNPVFPFLFDRIPTLGWDERNLAPRLAHLVSLQDAGGATPLLAVPAYLLHLAREHFLLPLGIVLALVRKPNRMPALAAALGGAAVLALGKMSRFTYPATLVIAFLAADELRRLLGPRRRLRMALLTLAALAPLGLETARRPPPVVLRPAAETRARQLGVYGEALHAVAERAGRRVLLAGEAKIHPLRRRVVCAGALYETPLIWKLTREAEDLPRLFIRFRQLGCGHLLYNFVSAQTAGTNFWPEPWNPRQLRLYRDLAKTGLRIVFQTRTIDQQYGGFHLYRIASRPGKPEGPVLFLPGADGAFTRADEALVVDGDDGAAIRAYRELRDLLPDVGMASSRLAFALHGKQRYREAYAILRPFIAAGMVDDTCLITYGTSALALGKPAEAIAILERAYETYPQQRENISVHLGDARRRLAVLRGTANAREP